MKNFALLVLVLAASACTTASTMNVVAGRQLTPKEFGLVGGYEGKDNKGTVIKGFLLGNGLAEVYVDGKKNGKYMLNWKLKEGDVYVGVTSSRYRVPTAFSIFDIKPNGDLTQIALIEDGKRKDIPRADQFTFKKIK